MNKDRWEKLQRFFEDARRLPPDERLAFVQSSEGDYDFVSQLLRMLEQDARGSFLDREIVSIAAEIFEESEVLPFETVGPYRLLRKLGAGGMGVVYLAERHDWKSKVAIKIPRDIWISSDRLKRFTDEQRLLARLVHPSIARIYEGAILANATPWFAMEYVDGEPITEYCRANGKSVQERLQLFLSVCDAVQYAHTHAIIHRDLKPSNILVTPSGEVKLLDFGIAKQLGDSLDFSAVTRIGQHPVTLAYAAPEQVLLNNISTQTDVYSLGVILYELLTGKAPLDFSGLTPSQAEEIVRTREPEKPSLAAQRSVKGDAPGDIAPRPSPSEWADLNVLILTAMHRDVARRYDSVDALRREINHYLKSEPLAARADTLTYRSAKFLRRRRVPVALSAAALALIIGLITYYTIRLAKARDDALAEVTRTRLAREFTQNLFEGGDQEVGPSKDLRVIDLLDNGLKKANALKGDPIQQGELYTTLGSLFVNLGEYPKADSALHSAYRILASADPHSHELAEVLVDLGILYSAEGHPEHAQSCIRKGVAIEEQTAPPDPRLVFKYKTALAYSLVQNEPRAAVTILDELLKVPSSVADDELQSDVWDLLATAYINVGEYTKAEPFARRVLAYTRRTRPADHPDIATELVNLNAIQSHLGQYGKAEKSLREALYIDQTWFHKDHPETSDVMRLLAQTLFQEHRFGEAMVFARRALADEEKAYGNLHPRVVYALHIVGRLALQRGSIDEAESIFKKEITASRVLKENTDLPLALSYLGDIYVQKKFYAKAAESYRASIAVFPRSPKEHSAELAETNFKLKKALLLEQR